MPSPSPQLAEKVFGVIKTKITTVEWVLDNFRAEYSNAAIGSALRSPAYPLCNSGYCFMRAFPKGRIDTYKEFLSIEVMCVCGDFDASVTLGILDKARRRTNQARYNWYFKRTAGLTGLGAYSFVKIAVIFMNPDLLHDGKLTIVCDLWCTASGGSGALAIHNCNNPSAIDFRLQKLDEYEELFESKKFSDVRFTVEGKTILGHRNIIGNKTPVFTAMFEHKMRENSESLVEIDDISYEALNELLRFIYVGRVKDFDRLAKDLLVASNKYLIRDLKSLCEIHISKALTFKNVVEYMNLATLHNASHLKAEGIHFIAENLEEISNSPDFSIRKLDMDTIELIFKSLGNSKKRKLDD